LLKDQIAKLEEKIAAGMKSTDAQEKAERRVRELAEERVQLIRDKQELQQRALILQEELSSSRDEGFILLGSEAKKEQQSADSTKVEACKYTFSTVSLTYIQLSACNSSGQIEQFLCCIGQVRGATDVVLQNSGKPG
jgi:hypothetical protein